MGSGCSRSSGTANRSYLKMHGAESRKSSVTYATNSQPDDLSAFPEASRSLVAAKAVGAGRIISSPDKRTQFTVQRVRSVGRMPSRETMEEVETDREPVAVDPAPCSFIVTDVDAPTVATDDKPLDVVIITPKNPPSTPAQFRAEAAGVDSGDSEPVPATPLPRAAPPLVHTSSSMSSSSSLLSPIDTPDVRASGALHDIQLSKHLTKLLRYKALEDGIQIDPDGWALVSDALVWVHAKEEERAASEREASSSGTTSPQRWTEHDVREMVRLNDRRRFEIRDGTRGCMLRATEGGTPMLSSTRRASSSRAPLSHPAHRPPHRPPCAHFCIPRPPPLGLASSLASYRPSVSARSSH